MDASQIVLTAEGRQKLVEELAWREGDYAKEIVEDIKEARAFGDLSENSEYDAAKDKQAQNAARIAGRSRHHRSRRGRLRRGRYAFRQDSRLHHRQDCTLDHGPA